MTREIIEITSEDQWLALRGQDITSTMSPALFDLSPYMTAFELYHAKKSNVHVPFKTNERIRKGTRMEQYAAQEVAQVQGWTVRPLNDYIRIPGEAMASSFDYEATCPHRGKGILEIKAVDFFQHKEKWIEEEAPEHIEIQLQHQLECADVYEWGCIVAFTGIYDFKTYFRDRDREMGQAIRKAVKKFWQDVAEGNEPRPDFYRDGSVIDEIYRGANGASDIDLTDDNEFEALLARYSRLSAEKKAAEDELAATEAEIHSLIQGNTEAYTERYKLTAGWTKDSPGTLVTPEMVGTYIGARRGYRQCLVKDLTAKKGK